MDRLLMNVASDNFEDAQALHGAEQVRRMCLGLEQMARALRVGTRDAVLMRVAADNFEDAAHLSGAQQMDRICLGLMQFARSI
jgi:hypothetical protein